MGALFFYYPQKPIYPHIRFAQPGGQRFMAKPKYVYFFGEGNADGNSGLKALLGGKGANLAEMTNIGVPVPPVSPTRRGLAIC